VKRQKGANSDRLLRSVFTRSLDVDSFFGFTSPAANHAIDLTPF